MIKNLPTHGFKWKKAEDFTPEKLDELVKKNEREYLLEVDVKYLKGLHKNYNELLFLAERIKIGREEKLVPNIRNKKGDVVQIKGLDQALKHGLKLKKVHRVIEFRQSKRMKSYIMLNTRLRKDAKNEFEKDIFKLMNSSIFGKTMKNIRNHKDMKLVASDKKYLKYVMKPNFKDGFPFSKHLFAVEMGKTKIMMNKPVYLGQAILVLSKTLMHEFHYDYMRPNYGSKVKLDTDSFITKTLSKEIMKRSRLRNKFLNTKSDIDRKVYEKQRNYVVSLLRKEKKDFYGNLDISKVTDNRVFWKIVQPKISDKVKIRSKITLVEDDKMLSQDAEIAKTFNEYFINIPILNMPNNQSFSTQTRSLEENTIPGIIESYKDHSDINLIKSKNSCLARFLLRQYQLKK